MGDLFHSTGGDFVRRVHDAFKRRAKALKNGDPRDLGIDLADERGRAVLNVDWRRGSVAFRLTCTAPSTLAFEVYSTRKRRLWKVYYRFRCERAWPNARLIERTFEDARLVGNCFASDSPYTAEDIARLDGMWDRFRARPSFSPAS